MNKIIKEINLSGLDINVVKLEPPAGDYSERIDEFWRRRDRGFGPYLNASLAGGMLPGNRDIFLFAETGGRIVARMGCIIPGDGGDVGTLGFVYARPEYRRKGISSALLGIMIEEFEQNGGIAMHLATESPDAPGLYEKHGFEYVGSPRIMRRVRQGFGDFEDEYYSYCGEPSAREVDWGDFPRIESLYSVSRHPWFVRDFFRGIWKGERKCAYEYEILDIMSLRDRGKGAASVIANNPGRVVGCASMAVSEADAALKTAYYDLFVMPGYFSSIPLLLRKLMLQAKELGLERMETWICEKDREKLEAVFTGGFRIRETGGKKCPCLSGAINSPFRRFVLNVE